MRCWTSINQAPIGVSQDCEDILDSTSCRRAWTVGVESANHLDLSGFAIGQGERNSVPPAPVCEDKKCCDWATCDLSLRAQECPTLTSGDRCKVMCAVGDTESAVFFIGSLLNSLAVSVVSQDWNGIAFLESCYFHCPDGHVPVNVHRLPVLDSTALLSGTLRLFIPFAERCLHRAVCFLKTTSWRAWIALI